MIIHSWPVLTSILLYYCCFEYLTVYLFLAGAAYCQFLDMLFESKYMELHLQDLSLPMCIIIFQYLKRNFEENLPSKIFSLVYILKG